MGAEDTASSDGGEGNAPGAAADVAAPAEDAGVAAVAASAEQGGGELRRRGAAAAAKPKAGAKGLAGKPAARPRPAHSKPVTVRRWMRENELLVYGAAIVLIMFMLLMLWWTGEHQRVAAATVWSGLLAAQQWLGRPTEVCARRCSIPACRPLPERSSPPDCSH